MKKVNFEQGLHQNEKEDSIDSQILCVCED